MLTGQKMFPKIEIKEKNGEKVDKAYYVPVFVAFSFFFFLSNFEMFLNC